MKKFQSKTASFVIALFIGAILISFAFTGFDGFNSTTGSVASVDGTPIKSREFQGLLDREMQRYSGIFGGKSLTASQIRQFKLRENVLNQLVQQKLILNFSNKLDLGVGEKAIKDQIKSLEFFQTNKKFDVNKYKGILAANRLTPSSYEETIVQDELLKQSRELISNIPVSKNAIKTQLELKSEGATVNTISFDKETNSKFITISKSEVKRFGSDEKNQKLLTSLFGTMQSEFNTPAQVQAKHILIKTDAKVNDKKALAQATEIRKMLTSKNFSDIANKKTQDPSGKGKGGDLGWFSRGKMVPAFENAAFNMQPGTISKPIKTTYGYHIIYVTNKKKGITKSLTDVKDIVTLRHLQRTKRDELDAFNKKLANDLKTNFEKNNISAVKKLASKYSLKFNENTEVSFLDKKVGNISFKDETLEPLLSKKEKGTYMEETASAFKIISVVKIKSEKDVAVSVAKELEKELSAQANSTSLQLQQDLIAKLQKDATVKSYLPAQ